MYDIMNLMSHKKNHYKTKSETIIKKFLDDPKNIRLVKDVEPEFIKHKLYTELIELYRLEFLYTTNPICFEKIGDILFRQKEYNEALDAYLNCAETTENYAQIYKKLGKVFGKINDNDSRLACIEQVKIIEGKNG